MYNKITDFIEEHFSKSMMTIFIPIFFSLIFSCYNGFQQYGHNQEFNQILKKKSEIDSIKSKLIDNSIVSHKQIKYSQVFIEILNNQSESTPIILKSINHYKYNNIPKDSLPYYIGNLYLINSRLPIYIGKLDAYSQVDILGRNAEKVININLLNSEYNLNNDLIEYLKGSLDKNQITTDKVNKYTSSMSAFETFHTDSLNIVNDNFQTPDVSHLKDDINDLTNTYVIKRKAYLIGMIISVIVTIILVFYFIKFDYHK